ncbi:MAG: CHASE2 domain-containing protein, partial [Bdellovibrionales bacterium]|nr:CHASE2 domain-containing protein [Bdellovibrionales bacterium]
MFESDTSSDRASRFPKSVIHISRALFAFVIAAVLTQFPFDYIESIFYDARIRLRPAPTPTGHIETIVVDTKTIQALGRVPNASDYRLLIERLVAADTEAIVSFINPSDAVGSSEELSALAETVANAPGFVVALDDVPLSGEQNALKLTTPFDNVQTGSAPVPIDRNIFARDDVSRRMMLAYQNHPTIYPVLARAAQTGLSFREAKASYDRSRFQGVFEYLQSDQAYVNFSPAGTYKPTSYYEVLANSAQANLRFKNKIVILGRDIQTTSRDYVRTPYSRDIVAMTIVELSANMFDTLIRNDA